MYIDPREHARMRYAERAIEKLLELADEIISRPPSTDDIDAEFASRAYRVLGPFRIARQKRHADAARIADGMLSDRDSLATNSGFIAKSRT